MGTRTMKRDLCYYGNAVLRQKAETIEKIDDEVRALAQDLIDTMEAANGIGLAAPQIGVLKRIFVAKPPIEASDGKWQDGPTTVYINPKIISHSDEELLWEEGCLSIPGLYQHVSRPQKIVIEAMDLEGKTFTKELENFPACNFLHENDHINGVLFIDRLDKKTKNEIKPILQKIKKKYNL